MKKNSCTPINPKKYSCNGLNKIHAKNLITKKNSCSSKIPLPPLNFSNGPSLKGQLPGIFKLEDIRLLFPTKTDIVSCDRMTISNQNKAWNRETSRRTVTTHRAIRYHFETRQILSYRGREGKFCLVSKSRRCGSQGTFLNWFYAINTAHHT